MNGMFLKKFQGNNVPDVVRGEGCVNKGEGQSFNTFSNIWGWS